jgi:hypothetical protein
MNGKDDNEIRNMDAPIPDSGFDKRCSQNLYEEKDPQRVILLPSSDYATQAWYAGLSSWDFAKAEPKKLSEVKIPKEVKDNTGTVTNQDEINAATSKRDAEDRQFAEEAEAFTRMVWKATTEVGFGIKGRFVVAWYCEAEGNTPNGYGEKWGNNVARDCDDDGVNTCYVERALKKHNDLRAQHKGGKPLTHYNAASQYIQE